jgi:cold shock CspA family protein
VKFYNSYGFGFVYFQKDGTQQEAYFNARDFTFDTRRLRPTQAISFVLQPSTKWRGWKADAVKLPPNDKGWGQTRPLPDKLADADFVLSKLRQVLLKFETPRLHQATTSIGIQARAMSAAFDKLCSPVPQPTVGVLKQVREGVSRSPS